VDVFALDAIERHDEPEPAKRVADAPGDIEPSGVGAIDDVDVVIAGHEKDARSKVGMAPDQVEEFNPLGTGAGVVTVGASLVTVPGVPAGGCRM